MDKMDKRLICRHCKLPIRWSEVGKDWFTKTGTAYKDDPSCQGRGRGFDDHEPLSFIDYLKQVEL